MSVEWPFIEEIRRNCHEHKMIDPSLLFSETNSLGTNIKSFKIKQYKEKKKHRI